MRAARSQLQTERVSEWANLFPELELSAGSASAFGNPDKQAGKEQNGQQTTTKKLESLKKLFEVQGLKCEKSPVSIVKNKLKEKFTDTARNYVAEIKKKEKVWSITVKNKKNRNSIEWVGFDPERAIIDLTIFFTQQSAKIAMAEKAGKEIDRKQRA